MKFGIKLVIVLERKVMCEPFYYEKVLGNQRQGLTVTRLQSVVREKCQKQAVTVFVDW